MYLFHPFPSTAAPPCAMTSAWSAPASPQSPAGDPQDLDLDPDLWDQGLGQRGCRAMTTRAMVLRSPWGLRGRAARSTVRMWSAETGIWRLWTVQRRTELVLIEKVVLCNCTFFNKWWIISHCKINLRAVDIKFYLRERDGPTRNQISTVLFHAHQNSSHRRCVLLRKPLHSSVSFVALKCTQSNPSCVSTWHELASVSWI